jgi:HlyD family secretion protein
MKILLRLLVLLLLAAGITLAVWPPAREQLKTWLNGSQPQTQVTLYGNVDIREVQLAFRQAGRLVSMDYDEGDRVKAGDVMARLDAGPYEDAAAAAEAEVRQASATLDKLRAGNRPEEIAQAEAEVSRAEATLKNAERSLQRQQKLAASGFASQSVLDDARAARDEAAASLAAAKEALALQLAGSRAEDIAGAEARLAAAKAALAQARTALSDTTLRSPSDAVVLARVVEPGSIVGVGAPVYSLSLRDPLYVRAYVSEPQLGQVAPGTKVEIRTDSSDKVYQGQIGFVSPRAEFTPKSVETTELRTDLVYRLRIVVEDADDGLRQGMPVTVTLDLTQEKP